MADQEMQDAPDMMSLNDARALMRATAAAGGSATLGPALLDRLVAHIDGLQSERDEARSMFYASCQASAAFAVALGLDEDENDPPNIADAIEELTAERNELRARLVEIEQQGPAAKVETSGNQGAGIGWTGAAQPVGAALYARPVSAIPDGEQLTCDVCGVVCRDPWHYSAGDRRHMHACDSCWPGVKAAPEAAR
jgi:hypothetical protein